MEKFIRKRAEAYCKDTGDNSVKTVITFTEGFEDAMRLLMNCANCRNGKTLFDEGCIGCTPAEHTKWMIREEK